MVTNAQTIDTKTFFKNPDLTSIRISPDGKHFAATVESDGTKKLAIMDIGATKIKHIFNFSSDKKEIGTYGWLNNERIYASMIRKVGPLAQPAGSGFLFAGNINGKKIKQLLPSRSRTKGGTVDIERGYRIISLLPEDDKHILITQVDDNTYSYAYKLNVYNAAKKVVTKSPAKYARMLADHQGKVRIATSFDEDSQMFKIHLKAQADDEWNLFKEFNEKEINMQPYGFSADNNKLIYFDSAADKEQGIYSMDLSTQDVNLLHTVEGDADIDRLIYDFNYNSPEIIGFSRMPGFVETEFFDPSHPVAKIYRALHQSFPGQVVNIVNLTRDQQLAVVNVWSDINPGNYYLFDLNKKKMQPLFNVVSWMDRKQLAQMQPISFKARDGMEIRGYLTKPVGKETQKTPLIVMVHGGPYGVADRWGYDREVQFFAHHGYSVLQVNYRGSGGRGSDFQYNHYREVGKEMQYDLTDATHWAIEQGHTDSNQVCIYGASYGGYAALMGVGQEPDLYQCAVGYVGLYDIDLTRKADTVQSEGGRRFLDEAWNYKDEAFIKERSPIYYVDQIKADIMLVHGGKDPRVPVKNFHDMSKALDKVGIKHEKVLEPYEGHGFYDVDNNVALYDKMIAFFNQHIGQ